MEIMQHTDELDDLYKNFDLPEVDVSQKVMERIEHAVYNGNRRKGRSRLVLVSIITAFVFCTGFAVASNFWELRDSSSNTILKLQEFETGDEPVVQDARYDEIFNKLEDGKAVAIYNTQYSSRLITYVKPVKIESLSGFKGKADFSYKLPSFIPEGYEFLNGGIQYEPADAPIIDEMREEAETRCVDIITKEVQVTDRISSIYINYAKAADIIKISIVKYNGVDKYNFFNDKTVEKTQIGGREALYIVQTGNNEKSIVLREEINGPEQTRKIAKGGKVIEEQCKTYLEYSISTSCNSLGREDLVKIAGNLKDADQ